EIEAIPSVEPSLTQSVLSEVDATDDVPADIENLTDFDKILFEARVYIKYRLFEHALDHVQMALSQQPRHVGARSLQARALTELGRTPEAADVHLQVAELVMGSDPKLAREHVGAARSLVPDHPRVEALADALSRAMGGAGPQPAAPVEAVGDDGDSGAFDLVTDDLVSDAISTVGPDDHEPPANLVAAHEGGGPPAARPRLQP
ncbi:MAG: hypothetical protein KDK70_44025, partial [Myxococcales bacterium]|nr:hypothetical protein [Myxococcales bacterium]